jgi:short-subunit dehydrogenase
VIPAPQPGWVALVTGASSGIGRELARQLSERGHELVIVARRRDRLEALAAELPGPARVVVCDVSEPAGREQLAAMGLSVDVLVPCAGFGMGGEFIGQDQERVQLMIRTNVESTVALCGLFAPAMAERRRGAILIVSSMAGNQPMTLFGAYAATKAAVTSFGEMLHEELRPYGVTATVLCPGSVSTEFASVADMTAAEKRVRGPFTATPAATARAGLEALEAGKRHVVPGGAVKFLHFTGGHAPRGLWLRACRKLMA